MLSTPGQDGIGAGYGRFRRMLFIDLETCCIIPLEFISLRFENY